MIDKDIDQKQHDEIINILNKNENKVKTCYLEAKQSTTAKIIVCLVTLVSIIPG
jgi:transcriptional regulator of NAD metabolism